jgi:hypothetical protein
MSEVGVGSRLHRVIPPLAESRESPSRRRDRQPPSERGGPAARPDPAPPADGKPHIDEVV